MKHLLLILNIALFSCKVTSVPLQVSYDKVKSVSIESVNDNRTITVEDKNIIEVLFKEYINRNKREIRKFTAQYRITIKYPDKNDLYIVNGKYFSYNGITYQMERDVSAFLSSLLLLPTPLK